MVAFSFLMIDSKNVYHLPPTGAGHKIAPNTVANATKIIVLATKIQKLVAKLATKTLWVLNILT